MCALIQNDDDEEDLYSDDDDDDGFDEDMEALRRACTLAGTNLNDLDIDGSGNNSLSTSAVSAEVEETEAEAEGNYSGGEEDDFELFKNVQNRFSVRSDSLEPPISLKPLCAIPPDLDDNEDYDFETLCAIRRRFFSYDNNDILRRGMENLAEKTDSVDASRVVSEIEMPNDSLICWRNSKVFPDSEQGADANYVLSDNMEIQPSGSVEQFPLDACKLPSLGLKESSGFPKSAQAFIDAIKRNRSCQKLLRSKLAQIEARIEENKKLKERVKILRDFQVSCRKITGRALAQGKDPRIQLIAARRDSKLNDKKVSAVHYGPEENSHVANYRMALANFPLLLNRKKWTEVDKENLRKGIRQQFQEMVLQFSVDQFGCSEGSPGDATNNLDAILASIKDMEITPESIRQFLPKVNWDQLASLYVVGRTGAECEAQWLNCEDPLVNDSEWTVKEDKKLLFIVQEKGMSNWFDIAVSLGSNRTPFKCLERFQRSLNAHIIKREWTKEEDAQLCVAVEIYGKRDWQTVASTLGGRTGTQCSNRWKKSLRPAKMGRWTWYESKRLEVAVMLFGPKNWKNIARFVPGRTDVQCRERWSNCLDPSLNMNKWTEDDDLRLKAAIEEFGYSWAKVAKCLPSRTDSQCRRRWKVLFPHEVPLLQAARRTQKAAIISNFVDRESERPALGPHDFVSAQMIRSVSEPETTNQSKKCKRKTREGAASGKDKNTPPCNSSKRRRSKRPGEGTNPISSVEGLRITNDTEVAVVTKRRMKPRSGNSSHIEPAQDSLLSNVGSTPLMITDGKGADIKRKKKLPKSYPERNELINIDGNSQGHLMSHPQSLEPRIPNVDGSQTFGGKNASSNEEKRTHEQQSRTNICTINSGEEQSRMLCGAITDGTELAHDHQDLLAITNAVQDDRVGQPDAPSTVTKRPLKRKIIVKSDDNINPERSELAVNNAEDFEMSSLDAISLSNASKVLKRASKRSIEPRGEGQFAASIRRQQNGHRKSKPKSKSCSKQALDMNDEDNITLASFLQNKKKRRLQAVKNADQTCCVPTVPHQVVMQSVITNIGFHEDNDENADSFPPPGFEKPNYRKPHNGQGGAEV